MEPPQTIPSSSSTPKKIQKAQGEVKTQVEANVGKELKDLAFFYFDARSLRLVVVFAIAILLYTIWKNNGFQNDVTFSVILMIFLLQILNNIH